MHEYSIVIALLERIDSEANRHDAFAVHRIQVRVGEVSGVEVDLLKTAYEIARENTLCAGAELKVVPVPATWTCPQCQYTIEPGAILRCPRCDSPAQLTAGNEIFLDQIELEVA